MDVKDKVLAFFRPKIKPSGKDENEFLNIEYMDEGIIDSMEIVTMIVEFEKTFGIHFSAEDMQSREFRNIGGLIGIIEQLMRNKKNA